MKGCFDSQQHIGKQPVESYIVSVLCFPNATLIISSCWGKMIWVTISDLGEKWWKTKRYGVFFHCLFGQLSLSRCFQSLAAIKILAGDHAQLLPAANVGGCVGWGLLGLLSCENEYVCWNQQGEYWLLQLEAVVTFLLSNCALEETLYWSLKDSAIVFLLT